MKFELYVALRYLKAKRKQAVISVITVISILGVAAGVMALIVALAIGTGFREDLQNKLLRGTAHINVMNIQVLEGLQAVRRRPGVGDRSAVAVGSLWPRRA